mgnify:CR=1 FL=1
MIEYASEEFCIPYLSPIDGRVHRYFPDFIMTRWPIFNIADSFVTVGMVFLSIQYLFFEKKEEKQINNQ